MEKRGLRLERDGGRGERQGVVSLAKKYKDDEEACFARVKELWDEKVGCGRHWIGSHAGSKYV